MAQSSSRRALLKGSVMAALGASAAAPAVAAAARPSPDAELIALCGRFDALEWQVRNIPGDAPAGSEDEAHADARRDALADQQEPLVERICALPCTTLEGARALAGSYALFMAQSLADRPGDYWERRMVAALMRALVGGEAAAAAVAAFSKPNPDAELIRMCDRYVALDREFCRLSHEIGPMLSGDPRYKEIKEKQDEVGDRAGELREEIATWTAETPEGLRALAQAARHTLSAEADRGAVDLLEGTDVAWVALESVLAMLDAEALVSR